jgi:low affinity Fe/Cu permease
MTKRLQRLLTDAGTWLSRPWAVGAVLIYAVLWLIFDRGNFGWHGVATIATLLMTLFIQRSEHGDTQAIHAKLDELLLASGKAQNRLTALDEKEPEQVEKFRSDAQRRRPF